MQDKLGAGMRPHLAGRLPGQSIQPSQFICLSRDFTNDDAALAYMNAFVNDPDMTAVLGLERGIPQQSDVRAALEPKLTEAEATTVAYFDGDPAHVAPLPPPPPAGVREFEEAFETRAAVSVLLGQASIEDAAAQFMRRSRGASSGSARNRLDASARRGLHSGGHPSVEDRPRARCTKFIRKNFAGYVFLLPWLIGFFCLAVGPIVASLYLSFTDYDAMQPPPWIGLENYEFMFQYDRRFWKALSVTFTFVLLSVPAKLIFALAVAMVLDKGVRAIGWYRALFYLPSILGGSIAVAVLWRQLFENDGVVNTVLGVRRHRWPQLAEPIRATR